MPLGSSSDQLADFHKEACQKDAVKRSGLANHRAFLRCSRHGALAAAAHQCLRSAENCTSAQLMLIEIRAAVSMLSDSAGVEPGAVVRFRPQLRLIQGGLS